MPRRAQLALLAALAAGAAVWAVSRRGGAPAPEWQRAAPVVPHPTTQEKVAFFFALHMSGEQLQLGSRAIPVWDSIGAPALVLLGAPALDYVLARDRYDAYRATPYELANVLHLLEQWRVAPAHPGFAPFLLHWLDPANCPRPTPGNDWVADFRKQIFQIMQLAPRAEFADACVDELRRKERVHDLRIHAIYVLLHSGEDRRLLPLVDSLPPDEDETEPDLRRVLTAELSALAGPGQAATARDVARRWQPYLEEQLRSADGLTRLNAATALGRLGVEGMAEFLIRVYEEADREGNGAVAWAAIDTLARDHRHPFARKVCFAEGERPENTFSLFALRTLGAVWIDDADVREALWRRVRASVTPDTELNLLRQLLQVERAKVVSYLGDEIKSGERERLGAAIRFAGAEPVPETGPWFLELARREGDDEEVTPLLGVLTQLRTRGTVPLLISQLQTSESDVVRNAAAAGLLQFGEPAGLAAVAEAIEGSDLAVLELLVHLATKAGDAAVPAGLVAPLLRAVRTLPNETARLAALYVLRCRGRLEDVEEGLAEAYQYEPSRRVATEIERVLVELAHR